MAAITPDVSSRLKPDFVAVVDLIYRDICNLQAHQKVLIISDARTPDYIVATFQGVALSFGAEAVRVECRLPKGGATYQPGAKWPSMLTAAAMEADLIIDMAVGYAEFIVNAIDNGAHVLCPGDGIGGPFLDDVLIRTVLHTDLNEINRQAEGLAELFTGAKLCTVLTADDTFTLDLTDLDGVAGTGFLWDVARNDWITPWASLPGAQPGVIIPMGRGNGTVNIDGTLLYHPDYHEKPDSPLRLSFRDGRLVDIGGDRILAARLSNWLDQLDDDGALNGPVHLNMGNNPNALQTQSQEWERVYGSITCGMGDLSTLSKILDQSKGHVWNKSNVHWDWTILQPKILLDDKVILENGKITCDF